MTVHASKGLEFPVVIVVETSSKFIGSGADNNEVMLDRDLAKLYGTDTKRVKEEIRRNIEKLLERFTWKLTSEELKYL